MPLIDQLRIISSAGFCAFFAILVSVEIANFYIERTYNHFLGAAIWFLLIPICILRILSVPGTISPEVSSIWISLILLAELVLSICWGVLLVISRFRRIAAMRKLLQGDKHAVDND